MRNSSELVTSKCKGGGGILSKTLLSLMVMVWVSWSSDGAQLVKYGKLAKTGPEYNDIVIDYTLHNNHLLKTITLKTVPSDSPQAVLECLRVCYKYDDCASIILRPGFKICYISRLDKCAKPQRLLLPKPGYISYDVRPGNISTGKTCFAACVSENDCKACGRDKCSGPLCEHCEYACWRLSPLYVGTVQFYAPSGPSPFATECNNEWQLIWNGNAKLWEDLYEEELTLLVKLEYEGFNEPLESYFDTVQFDGNFLTVGNFIDGNGGNGWNAPFDNRLAIQPKNSTCLTFFYTSEEGCEAGGAMPYKEQLDLNYTLNQMTRGYFWPNSLSEYNGTLITSIQLWMKPISQEQELSQASYFS